MEGLTASDVLAMTGTKENGFLEGNGIIILILFFLLMGGGFGWGGNNTATQGAITRAEVQDEISTASMQNAINSGFAGVNSAICATNQNISDMAAGVTLGMNNGFNSVNQNISNMQSAMQLCCCDLKTTMNNGFTALGNLVQQNEIQSLRDKIADKDRELQTTSLAAAMLNQTNNLEAYLRQVVNGGCGCGC